jgi:hypothetical protein
MHRHHRMARRKQPIHDQATGPFHNHREVIGQPLPPQPIHRHQPADLRVRKRPPIQHLAGLVQHRHIVRLTGPVEPDILHH